MVEGITIGNGRMLSVVREGDRFSLEIMNADGTADWGVDLSWYEAEKLLNKLEELVGHYDVE